MLPISPFWPTDPPKNIDDYVAAGRAVQRFWLTATSLGLQLQPEMTPLIFGRYVRAGTEFSSDPAAMRAAAKLADRLSRLFKEGQVGQVAFLGRIGTGQAASSRSLRQPSQKLLA